MRKQLFKQNDAVSKGKSFTICEETFNQIKGKQIESKLVNTNNYFYFDTFHLDFFKTNKSIKAESAK